MGKGIITFSDEDNGDRIQCKIEFDPPLDLENDVATPAQIALLNKWTQLARMADEVDE